MKMLRIIMILLGALLLTNCSGDFEQETGIVPSHSGQVSFCLGCSKTMRPWCRHAEANRSRSLVCGMLLPMNVERLLSPYIRSWKKTSQN